MLLTPEEILVLEEVGFDADVFEHIKRVHGKQITRLTFNSFDSEVRETAPGISWTVVDGNKAEQLMGAVSPHLSTHGYRVFWSLRRTANGLRETDQLAVLKTCDPYAMLRLRSTNGANYDISTDDIINRLSSWREFCEFDVVGASEDWVAIVFSRIPERICAFAEDVYVFCPDSVGQGFGFFPSERREPERFEEARQLCPEVSDAIRRSNEEKMARVKAFHPEAFEQFQTLFAKAKDSDGTEMGIRLMALDILKRKYLFLWWD